MNHAESYTIEGNGFAGWTEPEVVWFQEDLNGNKLPDEAWYEVNAGTSTAAAPLTRRYSITFFKTDEADNTVGANEYGQILRDVYWVDSKGRTGLLPGGWPWMWEVPNHQDAWVTYTATLLSDTGFIRNADTYDFVLPDDGGPFVDHGSPEIPISRAIAADGSPVTLTDIRFVKVHTGVFRYGTVFGELSTEINTGDNHEDKHFLALPLPGGPPAGGLPQSCGGTEYPGNPGRYTRGA